MCWNYKDGNIFASVGDDKRLMLWDFRQKDPIDNIEAHTNDIMSIDYSPFEENLLITGSSDRSVALWDARNMKTKIHSFIHHQGEITQVKFSRL